MTQAKCACLENQAVGIYAIFAEQSMSEQPNSAYS